MVGIRPSIAKMFAVFALFFAPQLAMAQSSEIANDNVGENINGISASAELEYGEGYGAVFDIPEAWIPPGGIEILGVRVAMFNGPNSSTRYCGRFQFDVYVEPMTAPQPTNCFGGVVTLRHKPPGTPIYQMTTDGSLSNIGFEVEGQPTMGQASFTDLLYDSINKNPNLMVTINPVITAETRVRVNLVAIDNACQQPGQKPPVLASDLNGVSGPARNFIDGTFVDSTGVLGNCGPYHFLWEDFGPLFGQSTPGDWVMRLIVKYDDGSMGTIDMGMDSGPNLDMGSDMTTTVDLGVDEDFGMSGMDSGNANNDAGGNNTTGNNNTSNNNSTGNNGTGAGLTITSVTPGNGPDDASTNIVIIGSGFELGAEVLVGAENVGVTEVESGRIRATVPEGFSPGSYDVIVTNPGGESAVLVGGFEVTSANGGTANGADGGCGCASGGDNAPGALVVLILGFAAVRLRRWRSAR